MVFARLDATDVQSGAKATFGSIEGYALSARFGLSSGRWTYGGRFYMGKIVYGMTSDEGSQSGKSLFRSQFDFEWQLRPWLELEVDLLLGQHFYPTLGAGGDTITIRRALLPGLLGGIYWKPVRFGRFSSRLGVKGGALAPLPAGDDQLQTGVAASTEASMSWALNRRWLVETGGRLELFRQSTQAVRFQILDLIFHVGIRVSLDTTD